jgi:hypothetical protein
LAYSGHIGAKAINPNKWERWNSTQQYIDASKVVVSETRKAKVAWPLREFGILIAAVSGIAGLFVGPVVGLVIGFITFSETELLAHALSRRRY